MFSAEDSEDFEHSIGDTIENNQMLDIDIRNYGPDLNNGQEIVNENSLQNDENNHQIKLSSNKNERKAL